MTSPTPVPGKMVQPGEAEAVAWMFELAGRMVSNWHSRVYSGWDTEPRLSLTKPFVDPDSIRNLTPLYPASALSAAYARGVASQVAVKPLLEWNPFEACPSVGEYRVSDHPMADGLFGAFYNHRQIGGYFSVAEAKAAAQAHYEAHARHVPASPSDGGNHDMDAAPFAWFIADPVQNEEAWEVRFERLTEQEKRDGLVAFPLRLSPSDEAKIPAPPKGGQ